MKFKTLKRLLNYLSHYRFLMSLVIVCALLSNLSAVIGPMLTGKAIDNIVSVGNVNFAKVLKIMAILGGIYLASFFFQWFLSIFSNGIANGTVKDIREAVFNKISTLPLRYFDQNPHGDIVNRLTNDIDAIAEGLIQGITQLFSGVVTLLGSLFFMFKISPMITLVVLVMTPVSFVVSGFIAKMSSRMFRDQSKTLGELNGYITEIIGNQKIVKAFHYESQTQAKFEEINGRLYDSGRKAQYYSSLTNPTTRYINHISYILCGVIGGLLALAGKLSIGDVSSFLIYATQFSKPINEITSISTQIQGAIASADRVFAVLDEEEEPYQPASTPVMEHPQGQISFQGVNFGYKRNVPLIKDLNLEIKAGSTVAIVGPTGAGKTTLVNLLMRFYDVNQGGIFIDGQNIQSVTRDSLRRSFGMVLQESWLFSGTVRENLAYGRPDATQEEIEAAAKAAYAHDFIKMLPQGYDTLITEEGGNLSQGQKQLLTIARIMLMNPPMLILDEATSSIDTLTEARVQKAFAKLMEGRTSFVIAHRLSTIREADVILVMKEGNIIETGTHESLLNQGGFYAKLYYSQYQAS